MLSLQNGYPLGRVNLFTILNTGLRPAGINIFSEAGDLYHRAGRVSGPVLSGMHYY